jgi:hypothetical protein
MLFDDTYSGAKCTSEVFIDSRPLAHGARIIGWRLERHEAARQRFFGSQSHLNVYGFRRALFGRLCAEKVCEHPLAHRLERRPSHLQVVKNAGGDRKSRIRGFDGMRWK